MAAAFPIYINGPKELQEYMSRFSDMKNKIKETFERGLTHDLSTVDTKTICRPFQHHQAEMRRISHHDFIRKTVTAETTGTEEAEAAINVALQQLERFRKMLVDNKQQRKTTHRQNCCARSHFKNEVAFNPDIMGAENELENDPRDHHPCALMLKQMDAASKQHHRTVASKILKEVNGLVLVIRQKLILAYQVATENASGAIMHHAEKSREFIQTCIQLAMVEFCATVWWNNTQKDPMDDAEYYVYATSNPVGHIRIVVKECLSDTVVFDECMNQEFADTIITADAVKAFEWEQQSLWFDQQAAMERHMNEKEKEEKAWNELADACCMEVDEPDNGSDNGSDYEPDTCGGYYN